MAPLLASFCNELRRGKERSSRPVMVGKHGVESGIGLESLQLFERAMKGSLKAGMVAREAIGLGIEQVDSGLEEADTAQIPGGCDQFVEEGLLKSALRVDFALIAGLQFLEGFTLFRLDDQLLGGEAVFESVL